MKKLLLFLMICSAFASGQKKILVSPYGDAIPITKSYGVRETIKRFMGKNVSSAVCSDKATFGFSLEQNPGFDINHIAFHQDIVAMWYVAPASGTIDSVFWYNSDVGSFDSTVTIRLFESNIYPGSGPGYSGYPSPGKLCWGYFVNTNDIDNGVAAFPEDATDTTWFSTVDGETPSFTPMGDEIWGYGGIPKVVEAFAVNNYDLGDLGAPAVNVGDPFFITVRVYGPHVTQADEDPTGFYAISEADSLKTHNWKFYEHIVEIQPGFTCPGWVARGEFNIMYWYTMTVTTNIPPTFSNMTNVHNTFSTDPQEILINIQDCDPESTALAGVENALLRYTINDVQQADIPLSYLGGDTWEAFLPGGSVNDEFAYKVIASDSTGFTDSTGTNRYRIVSLASEWYTADTGASCTEQDISSTGTLVNNASFFVPEYAGSGTAPGDDGTSGPYDMGHTFTFFGDTFRYAWIGVNGALALGKGGTDTIDVNANGFATSVWDFPYPQTQGRTDTAGASNMPGMFIAPFWADLIVSDTLGTYGAIRYGDNGDTCLFVVEWDSLGAFDLNGAIDDITTFRAVLNRCDGTVQFQYKSVGTYGLDSAALVGMQADSNEISGPVPGWIYVNRNTYPIESKPRDNWCVRLLPNVATTTLDGWNMVAVSLAPEDAQYTTGALFPEAVSPAYKYASGYLTQTTLSPGTGYWLKFPAAGSAGSSPATFIHEVSAPVNNGWNMIGGPSDFIPVASIDPVGVSISSAYYSYGDAGYASVSAIQPGKGVWVKVAGNGTLGLGSSAAAPKADITSAAQAIPDGVNRITFTDASGRSRTLALGEAGTAGREAGLYELPPVPPSEAFDIRFASQRSFEEYALGTPAGIAAPSFPVLIQGAKYPVSVRWEVNSPVPDGRTMVLASADGKTVYAAMEGSGTVRFAEPPAGSISVRFPEGVSLPSQFALSPNYPNPFNPVTRFTVSLPRAAAVEVVVFDLLGRRVNTLLNEQRPGGSYTVEWDGRDLNGIQMPTGIYIVRMLSGDFSEARKVMLMK